MLVRRPSPSNLGPASPSRPHQDATSSMSTAIHRSTNIRRLRRNIGQSFREVGQSIRTEAREKLRRVRRVPRWVRLLRKTYHEYGLKHLMLILILAAYQFLGAGIFYFCEVSNEESKELHWKADIEVNRTKFIDQLVPTMFNNTDYLFFLTSEQTTQVSRRLNEELAHYEKQLGIKYSDQKIRWDFWNAMLYAQTICTTIGYGHLYPSTVAGRVFTMLYAIVGIPLVLSILDDLGKLLTKCLKTPWFLMKCGCRRLFIYCTKQSMSEIRRLDEEDRRDLAIFDLPIPVAIFIVIAWIFICSATFCIWEQDWDYFVAFYFFFISLSTIGLGDITPTQPKYLLMLFGYIIIGLSLVSMCINLIQAKLERTYEAGRGGDDTPSIMSADHHSTAVQYDAQSKRPDSYRGGTLGVIQRSSSYSLSSKQGSPAKKAKKRGVNRTSQTLLSFPSPTKNRRLSCTDPSGAKIRVLPRTLSIDDVMRIVDTEEGDMVILAELSRDVSVDQMSDSAADSARSDDAASTPSGSQGGPFVVVSKSFDVTNFHRGSISSNNNNNNNNSLLQLPGAPSHSASIGQHPSLHDIEEIEELEDRILLQAPSTSGLQSSSSSLNPGVHFRSRLSLIPEHQGLMEGDEDAEEDQDDDDTRPLELDYQPISSSSPPVESFRKKLSDATPRRISNFIGGLLSRTAGESSSRKTSDPGTSGRSSRTLGAARGLRFGRKTSSPNPSSSSS